MPPRKPHALRKARGSRVSAAAVIGFSLTLVGTGIATLFGLVPHRMLPALDGIDATILLLFVPLCALTFAILAEAVRSSFSGSLRPAVARAANPLEPWRPGSSES